MIEVSRPKFAIGQLVATPGALEVLAEAEQTSIEFVVRHVRGDWGEVCEEDKQANEDALQHGERLLSAYHTKKGVKLWVITEADRSSTCVLLPEEY
jgi:hypothetical protein